MIYTIQNESLRVEVNSYGAELWSLTEKQEGKQYLWQGDASIWELRAPVIFPYCGRLKDFKYRDEDGVWHTEQQNHGFARFMDHDLKEKTEDSVTLILRDNEETWEKYPYHFTFETCYRLEGATLHCIHRVKNTGERKMPFNLGYHPGFFCPFSDEYQTGDYEIRFEQRETPIQLESEDDGQLRTGKETIRFRDQNVMPLSDGMFPKNFCLTGLKSKYLDLVEKPTGRFIRVSIDGFQNVVFWSKPGKLHFLCVEPWTGCPDSVDSTFDLWEKRDIQTLEPGAEYAADSSVSIGGKSR